MHPDVAVAVLDGGNRSRRGREIRHRSSVIPKCGAGRHRSHGVGPVRAKAFQDDAVAADTKPLKGATTGPGRIDAVRGSQFRSRGRLEKGSQEPKAPLTQALPSGNASRLWDIPQRRKTLSNWSTSTAVCAWKCPAATGKDPSPSLGIEISAMGAKGRLRERAISSGESAEHRTGRRPIHRHTMAACTARNLLELRRFADSAGLQGLIQPIEHPKISQTEALWFAMQIRSVARAKGDQPFRGSHQIEELLRLSRPERFVRGRCNQ